MRLIDADVIIDRFEELFHDDNVMNPIIKVLDVLEIIDEQPTAYDIDKIVEQLEEKFLAEKNFRAKGCWLDAIEIVKGGAV